MTSLTPEPIEEAVDANSAGLPPWVEAVVFVSKNKVSSPIQAVYPNDHVREHLNMTITMTLILMLILITLASGGFGRRHHQSRHPGLSSWFKSTGAELHVPLS